jgi:hypothetical protein
MSVMLTILKLKSAPGDHNTGADQDQPEKQVEGAFR